MAERMALRVLLLIGEARGHQLGAKALRSGEVKVIARNDASLSPCHKHVNVGVSQAILLYVSSLDDLEASITVP